MGKKPLKRERDAPPHSPDSEKPAKRRRQINADDIKLSKLYEDLAAESDETRLEAAKQIIVKFSPSNQPSAEATEKVLHRLVRGLCSQRKAARFGFCVTLTELLRQFFGKEAASIRGLKLDVDGIIQLVEDETKVEGNIPGQERRDHIIGKLFGYKAIMQSGILVEPDVSIEPWNKVLDYIYGMARDIPWLREECGLILVEAIKNVSECPMSQKYVQELVQRLVEHKLTNTPEGVAIWLTIQGYHADVLPPGIWYANDPLHKKERVRLAKILKEDFRNISENGSEEKIKSAAANPNPIFAWDVVISDLLRRDKQSLDDRKDSNKAEFPQFWIDAVDNNLFASSASHERKSWGFKLLATLVTVAPTWAIPALFSPNLMRCLMNQSKKDDRFLHAAALIALKAVQARVQAEPSSAHPIFIALTTKHSTIELDKITKTKTLEQMILSADDETLPKIIHHLRTLIFRPESQDQATADVRRQTIADILLATVKNYKHYGSGSFTIRADQSSWLRDAFDILVEVAYFVPSSNAKTSKVPLPPITDSMRKIYQERLSSCLTRLLNVETDSKASFALLVVQLIQSKAMSAKALEPVFKADDSVKKTLSKALQNIDALAAKASKQGKRAVAEGLTLLYSLALLQVYDGDTDAVLLLDDLNSSQKALLKSKKDGGSEGQDSFVEIILSFLGNPRTLFRNIAGDTFSIFASDLTLDGLQSLTDVLDTAETLEGQRELFSQGDDEGADVGSEDELEDASDVEMIDSEGDDSDSDGSRDSDSGSTSGSDEDEEDDEELDRFNELLAHTLQTSRPSPNDAASDDSSDDEDMDDDQMMALDPHLTKIFQERSKMSSKKKQREDAKQTVVQFKSRVLDLLSIFMEKQYSNPLTLEVLLPLLRRIRANTNKQLADKSYKILKSYTDSRAHHKAPLPKPTDLDIAWKTLSAIHEEAKLGGGSTLHATACSNASLHIVKILVGLDKQHYSKVADVYLESQKQWFMDKKSNFQPTLFTQFQNWSVSARQGGK